MHDLGGDIKDEKFVMKCQKYYYIKKEDEISGDVVF